MPRSDFLPSIHGWPFINRFTYTFPFKLFKITMGFCGGMCWKALDDFYAGIPVPRNIALPNQGEPLYNELLAKQIVSLPPQMILKIFDWQQCPDLSSWHNIRNNQGYRSQKEWPAIQALLDRGKPVTITLIASSGDVNPLHLTNCHRVVAYDYKIVPPTDDEWIHGPRNGQIRRVDLSIYDPNYPGDDGVSLSFYLNCRNNWIGLSHGRGNHFHGFFKDDNYN